MEKILVLVLCAMLSACDGSDDSSSQPVELTSLTLTPTSVSLSVGTTQNLTAKATYSDGSTKTVTNDVAWASNQSSIASVDSFGLVSALAAGDAIVTASLDEKSSSLIISVSVSSDVSLTYQSNILTFKWLSTFDDEKGYAIQKSISPVSKLVDTSDNWLTIASTGPVTSGFYGQQTIDNETGEYRVVAVMSDNSEVTLSSDDGTTDFMFDEVVSSELSIVNPPESQPYQGNITFELSQPVISSQWFIDSNNACISSSSCNTSSIALDTSRYTDGSHRLDCIAEVSPDVFVYLNEQISIYNPDLTLSMTLQDQSATSKLILVNVTSKAIVDTVTYYVDGMTIATQDASTPITINQCDKYECYDVTYPYHYVWGSEYGDHTIKVSATDSDGEYNETDLDVLINHAPQVTITTPEDSQLVTTDTLVVSGSIDNENDNVTTTVAFGDIQIGQKQGTGGFSYTYSLAGLPENDYMVSIVSVDEFNARDTEQVSFKYAPSLAGATLIHTVPDSYSVVEINDDQLLTRDSKFNYLIIDLNQSIQTSRLISFPHETMTYMYHPHVNDKGYFSSDYGPAGSLNMYLNKDGTTQNLTEMITEGNGYGFHSSFINKMLVQLPSDGSAFYLWDSDSVTYEYLDHPEGTGRWLNWRFTNNDEWLCQSAPINLGYDVYIYQFGSQVAPTRLTDNGGSSSGSLGYGSFCAGNDSQYAFYITQPQNSEIVSLFSYNIMTGQTNNLASGLTNSSSSAIYNDGILAWKEKVGNAYSLHIQEVATGYTTTISNATLSKVSFGKVSYTTNDGLFIWNSDNKISINKWPDSTTHYLGSNTNYVISGQLIYDVGE